MFLKYARLGLGASGLLAQQGARVDLARLPTGATVSFVRSTAGEWGIEIMGGPAPRIRQPRPAKLEVLRTEEDIRQLAGSVDEYLDWAVPSYAKLYNLTKDEHYLDVARVLLHDTKSMAALPGRQYDVKGVGWQQEGWRMGPGGSERGVGGHCFWLPWVSANHPYGITGLEEYDPALFKQLSTIK